MVLKSFDDCLILAHHQILRCGMQALEKHGVGNWREISEQYLPKWDDQAIRIKASRLMGSQSLARYIGWKGNR